MLFELKSKTIINEIGIDDVFESIYSTLHQTNKNL